MVGVSALPVLSSLACLASLRPDCVALKLRPLSIRRWDLVWWQLEVLGIEIPRVRIWPPRRSHSLSRLGQPPVHIHSLLSGHTEEGSLSFLNIALVT